MNEEIKLEIQYTVDDYVRGSSFVLNRQFIFKYGSLIVLCIPVVIYIFSYLNNPEGFSRLTLKTALISFAPVLALCFLFLFLKFFSNPFLKWNLKRQFNSSPLLRATQEITFDEVGVKGETNLSSAVTKWDAVVEAAETDEDFFFFVSNKKALFIPKRGFESTLEQDRLRALAKRKLAEKAKL
jgi:hypothetical protein